MNTDKLINFKQRFLQHQQEIIKTGSNRLEELDVEGGDEVDLIQCNLLRSMMEKLTLRDKETLKKINEALQRIEDGSFGDCEECGEAIPEKRLSAVPYSTTCIDCAEQKERLAKQYRV